jgi:DNA-binding beta-propeller fold protein YncE
MKRIPCVGCLALIAIFATSAMRQADARLPRYVHETTVYLGMAGLAGVAFDPAANRLWVGDRRGLRWVDLAEARPRLSGPLARIRITGPLEFAADASRLFFEMDDDHIAYLDVRTSSEPVRLARIPRVTDLLYEPRRKELYVFSTSAHVAVFDAVSGAARGSVELPGPFGLTPVAIGGRVYLTVSRTAGVFAIDGATGRVDSQPVGDRKGTPVGIEADVDHGRLFLVYEREIVALDLATGAVLGQVTTTNATAIAYDAAAGLLVATNRALGALRIETYHLEAAGLLLVDRTGWVEPGVALLEPTRHGFVQLGQATSAGEEPLQGLSASLLIWRARPR